MLGNQEEAKTLEIGLLERLRETWDQTVILASHIQKMLRRIG
jgi:hypothetical protein